MANTEIQANAANSAGTRKPTADEVIARIDAMKNARGDIGVSFPRSAKYLPEWRPTPANETPEQEAKRLKEPAFYVPNGIAFASGDKITSLVDKAQRDMGKEINAIVWGRNSRIERGEDGKFPTTKFNVFAAAGTGNILLQKAAFQSIYDGATENGRARQFLVANGSLLHNTVREPAKDGQGVTQSVKRGVESLTANKGTTMLTSFVSAEDLKAQVRERPAIAPYLDTALAEANKRYVQTREQTKARGAGVER